MRELLAKACAESSQAQVAKKIGYSTAVVNLYLKDKYEGDVQKLERVIKLKLGKPYVDCPVLGQIQHSICQRNQAMPFSAASQQRVQLFKACMSCKYNNRRSK